MVSINGGSMGNVCQYRSYNDYTITAETGEEVCKKAGYSSLEKIDYLGNGARYSSSKYRFATDYYPKMYNLRWSESRNDFTYYSSSSCSGSYYYTFISCQCEAGFYNSTLGCMKCPAGSTSPAHSSICHCPAGTHWTQGYCKPCPKNTYSPANSTECTACTLGANSNPGSEICLCDDGLYMNEEGLCKPCGNGNYSYSDSNFCSVCPEGSTAGVYQGFCTCPAGQRWEFNLLGEGVLPPKQGDLPPAQGAQLQREGRLHWEQAGFCVECEPNHYSKVNSTYCSACPDQSTSPSNSSRCFCKPGYKWVEMNATYTNHTMHNRTVHNHTMHNHTKHNRTAHNYTTLHDYCEICPENYYSKYGAVNCTQCPHFKAAVPGSEYCYRCTLGQFWENHTCVQCPEHLFGDGVHCNHCPDGFKVQHGFCYKSWEGTGEEIVAERSVGMSQVVESSSASYFGAVFTTVLLFFGYSKRDVLKQLLMGLKVSIKGTVEDGVDVSVRFDDLMARAGEREVRSEDEAEEDEEEEEFSEDGDVCCRVSPAQQIEENVYSEQIYEDI